MDKNHGHTVVFSQMWEELPETFAITDPDLQVCLPFVLFTPNNYPSSTSACRPTF